MNKIRMIGSTILGYRGLFSIDKLAKDTKIDLRYCTNTLFKFCRQGLTKKISKLRYERADHPGFVIIYLVVDRKGLAARIAPKLRKGPVQDRAWSVIWNKFKVSRAFNLHDIVVLGNVNKGTAKWYFKILRRANIIAKSHRTSRGFEWRLTGKHLGPSRPYLQYEKLTRDFGPERPYLDCSRKRKKTEKHGLN